MHKNVGSKKAVEGSVGNDSQNILCKFLFRTLLINLSKHNNVYKVWYFKWTHLYKYEPRSAQCSLPLCALCPLLCAPYSVSSFHVYHFLSAPGRSSRAGESTLCFFFAFCLPVFCLLFALSTTCFRFLLLASLPSSLSFLTFVLYGAMLFCLRLFMCECS